MGGGHAYGLLSKEEGTFSESEDGGGVSGLDICFEPVWCWRPLQFF